MDASIVITAAPSPVPAVCLFTVNRALFPGGSFNCASAVMAKGSPLLEDLFALGGVRQILVRENTLTVEKETDEPWPSFGKKIGAAIRERLALGGPLVARASQNDPALAAFLERRVREVLDADINPGVASHGGEVHLEKVEGTRAFLRLSGGCQGCG